MGATHAGKADACGSKHQEAKESYRRGLKLIFSRGRRVEHLDEPQHDVHVFRTGKSGRHNHPQLKKNFVLGIQNKLRNEQMIEKPNAH